MHTCAYASTLCRQTDSQLNMLQQYSALPSYYTRPYVNIMSCTIHAGCMRTPCSSFSAARPSSSIATRPPPPPPLTSTSVVAHTRRIARRILYITRATGTLLLRCAQFARAQTRRQRTRNDTTALMQKGTPPSDARALQTSQFGVAAVAVATVENHERGNSFHSHSRTPSQQHAQLGRRSKDIGYAVVVVVCCCCTRIHCAMFAPCRVSASPALQFAYTRLPACLRACLRACVQNGRRTTQAAAEPRCECIQFKSGDRDQRQQW